MAELLETMLNDAEVAERVAGGDFADLGEGELTEAERALLTAAGSDLDDDDVSGFGGYFLKLGDIDGESKSWKVEEGGYMKIEMEKVNTALNHVGKVIYKF